MRQVSKLKLTNGPSMSGKIALVFAADFAYARLPQAASVVRTPCGRNRNQCPNLNPPRRNVACCACGPASLHVSEHARARPCLYACVCSRACHVRVVCVCVRVRRCVHPVSILTREVAANGCVGVVIVNSDGVKVVFRRAHPLAATSAPGLCHASRHCAATAADPVCLEY